MLARRWQHFKAGLIHGDLRVKQHFSDLRIRASDPPIFAAKRTAECSDAGLSGGTCLRS
jgi:hypothetical protein